MLGPSSSSSEGMIKPESHFIVTCLDMFWHNQAQFNNAMPLSLLDTQGAIRRCEHVGRAHNVFTQNRECKYQ